MFAGLIFVPHDSFDWAGLREMPLKDWRPVELRPNSRRMYTKTGSSCALPPAAGHGSVEFASLYRARRIRLRPIEAHVPALPGCGRVAVYEIG